MYRPKGWKYGSKYENIECAVAYEFGADAMLEALRERSKAQAFSLSIKEEARTIFLPEITFQTKGWLVFIHEEE